MEAFVADLSLVARSLDGSSGPSPSGQLGLGL
jgi:hypothetical protein